MGRFFKELKYSLGLKRHVFFLVLICFVVCGACWLFQGTLKQELEEAFPSKYAPANVPTETKRYNLQGTVAQKSPQVTDADLKAEIAFNAKLREAQWIDRYEQICLENVQIASFIGPDSAVKGYQTDAFLDNKDIESGGSKYTTVNAIWMEESLATRFNLGKEAQQIYKMPNDYLDKIYVVLGSAYRMEDGYGIGTILKARNSIGAIQLQVVGFLPAGAKATVEDKEINLDSYVLCPFISLEDVYEIKPEIPQSYMDGVYIPAKFVTDELNGAYRNNPANKKNDTKTGLQYAEVKCLYIDRSALTDDAPIWLKALVTGEEKEDYTRIAIGANYGKAGTILSGTSFDMYSGGGLKKLQSFAVLEPGTTWKVYGMDIELDDYIVFLQPEEKKEEKSEEETPEGTDILEEVFGPEEKTFKVAERATLFHYQFLMNNGHLFTTSTADEAQEELDRLTDLAWADFRRDNAKKTPLTSYRISDADQPNSILFRESSATLWKKILKFTKIGFPFCMIIFALFLFFKFRKGRDYYTALYMTGTNRVEIIALYVIEAVLMIALAAACSFAFAFVICKLLQLKLCPVKPLVMKIVRLVGIPTLAIIAWIVLKDFGRIFRRTEEV